MTKKEWVFAALHNEKTDYVPGCFWRHYAKELKNGEDIVKAHMKFYREVDVDFIKISADGYMGWPEETVKHMTDVSDLYHMGHLTLDHPFMAEQLERISGGGCKLGLFRGSFGHRWDQSAFPRDSGLGRL